MRHLKEHEIPAAAEIIAEASVNDPYWAYMIPDLTSRFHFMRKFLKVNLQIEWTRGHLMGVGEPLQGIAVWSPPELIKNPRNPQILTSLQYLRLLSLAIIRLAPKIIRVFRRYRAMRVKHAVQPYYHLILIGVAPSSQGKGYARKLIRPILDEADRERFGAYVETTNPHNVAFYEHFGFELKEEFSIPNTSLRGWSFYRSPNGKLRDKF